MTPKREQDIRAKILGIIHQRGAFFPNHLPPGESMIEWEEVLQKMVADGKLSQRGLEIDKKFPGHWYMLNV